jgi:NADH-quinone oxidoreductase subunit G
VLLPIGSFAETSGTYVNLEGQWQSFSGAAQPVGQSRPGWKVLRVLGNLFGFGGFEQQSSEEVREDLKVLVARGAGARAGVKAVPVAPVTGEVRVVDVPAYQVDSIVRRAASLQRTREGRSARDTFGVEPRA